MSLLLASISCSVKIFDKCSALIIIPATTTLAIKTSFSLCGWRSEFDLHSVLLFVWKIMMGYTPINSEARKRTIGL
jgi:hypothetical protein